LNIAIIPARGGSKSIPAKNLLKVDGTSLVGRAIVCAANAGISKIYLTTDDKEIAAEARDYGASVIIRPTELASDISSSESAILHALEEIGNECDSQSTNIAFLQATSPFTSHIELQNAIKLVSETTSTFSAITFHNFVWQQVNGDWRPLGHEKNTRLMKQEMLPTVMETGNFYCFPKKLFEIQKSRFCGNPIPSYVNPLTTLQIDSLDDYNLALKFTSFFK
jgi:N-acylneuraminate cytidylyltransferase